MSHVTWGILNHDFKISLSCYHTIAMPAIEVPQLRLELKKIVKYPTPPTEQPIFKDVVASINLYQEVLAAHCLCRRHLSITKLTLVS